MYTILVNDSHELITTRKEQIMQKSKLINTLHFLVPPYFQGINMNKFTVCLQYILPVSRKYCNEILIQAKKPYKGYLEYRVPMDTNLTDEAGDIEVMLSFVCVDLHGHRDLSQRVRTTKSTIIHIEPVALWSDIVPDRTLSAVDQRLVKAEAMIRGMEMMNPAYGNGIIDLDALAAHKPVKPDKPGKPKKDAPKPHGSGFIDLDASKKKKKRKNPKPKFDYDGDGDDEDVEDEEVDTDIDIDTDIDDTDIDTDPDYDIDDTGDIGDGGDDDGDWDDDIGDDKEVD